MTTATLVSSSIILCVCFVKEMVDDVLKLLQQCRGAVLSAYIYGVHTFRINILALVPYRRDAPLSRITCTSTCICSLWKNTAVYIVCRTHVVDR